MSTVLLLIILTLNSCKCVVNYGQSENLMMQNQSRKAVNFMENNDDLIYLSELPLDKLLKVKKTIEEIIKIDKNDLVYDEDYDEIDVANYKKLVNSHKWNGNQQNASRKVFHHLFNKDKNYVTPPSALPLINNYNHNFNRKGGLEHWDGGKPSKIQMIFQLSVTALAFLAFAGYLLCMIVQAIKSKGTTYYHAGGFGPGVATTSPIRKRKPIGRRRRNVMLSSDNRNDTLDSLYEESLATPDPDEMFQVMIRVAEGYVKIHHLY